MKFETNEVINFAMNFATNIGLTHYLILSAVLFCIAVAGIILNRKNIITILLCIELIFLSVQINLVAFSAYHADIVGQVFVMFILTVAACEVAIGLAIIITYFRNTNSIKIEDVSSMKG